MANDTTGHEPLSDAQLESFRQTADDARRVNTFWSGQYAWTVARLLDEVERQRASLDETLGLAMAVANGWPESSAPAYVREEYIDALRDVARELVERHPQRVAALRAENARLS